MPRLYETNLPSFSLKRRALLFLTPFFLLFFVVLAYILQGSVERSLAASTQEQLTLQVRLLLANIDVDDNGAMTIFGIEEPRLKQPDSDLLAFIYDKKSAALLWESPSAAYSTPNSFSEQSFISLVKQSQLGDTLFEHRNDGFALAYTAAFEVSSADVTQEDEGIQTAAGIDSSATTEIPLSKPYTVVLFDNGQSYATQLDIFKRTLASGLLVALLIFLALHYRLLHWLFKPLGQIEQELGEIEKGQQKRFQEKYPSELAPLTNRLNQIMEVERVQRERYKNTLADLAHSIKTPLAVIRSMPNLASGDAAESINEQIERMEQIVSHQLRRSAMPALEGSIYRADATAIVQRISASLQKLYFDKAIKFNNGLPDQLLLRMPEDDLFELMGNLLDNAFKYGDSEVCIAQGPSLDQNNSLTTIVISNDGKVIAHAKVEQATQRGVRLDESAEGQGIGLSVANAIVKAYQGELMIQAEEALDLIDTTSGSDNTTRTVISVSLPAVHQ